MEIIDALLDMERDADYALTAIQREKDKLPARIAAETGHIRYRISQELAVSIQKLREEYAASTALRIQAIEEECDRRLTDIQSGFAAQQEALRINLFQRLTKWTTLP